MANDRLRSALAARTLTVDAVAARAGVDPKTVQRWLTGRIPHARHRWAVAALVREDEAYLWPTVVKSRSAAEAERAELLTLYPHRADVPSTVWRSLLDRVQHQLAILVYAAAFLPEQQLDLVEVLRAKAAAGCQVRVALGDPSSPKLLERGAEENFGIGISSRAELALKHYAPLRACPGVEIRVHGTTLYNSIYRFDDVMLVNTHIWGLSAFGAPVLHLRRLVAGGLFDTYAQSFEAVWATARPAYSASE
jgi:transcriptional regulator with XRE-family HTH domain